MAQIQMSMDTNSRQCVLMIDGVIVACENAHMAKFTDYEGNPQVAFQYEQRTQGGNGMMEMHRYRMPYPEEMRAEVAGAANEHGLVQSKVADTTKAKRDIQSYFGGLS